jgi:hypothetical protein
VARRRRGRRQQRDLATGIVVVAILLAFSWIALSAAGWLRVVASDLDAIDARIEEAVEVYREVPPLSDDTRRALRRSLNADHLAAARRSGTAVVTERDDLADAAESRGLVHVQSDTTRVVRAGRHSVPYVTPAAAASIDSITTRFHRRLAAAGLPAFRITLSSIWRSTEDQANLARVNVNAARGRSSHEYATTYDIPYRRFEYAGQGGVDLPRPDTSLPALLREYVRAEGARRLESRFRHLAEQQPAALEAALGRTLVTLEDDSVILVIREVRQPVYHVTALK